MDEALLVKEYRTRLLYFILRRVRNRAIAEELTQETLMIVVQAVRQDKLRDPSKLGAYIFGVAGNLILKYRSDPRSAAAPENPDPVPDTWAIHAEAELLLKEERAGVRRALDQLSAPDREILYHSFVEAEGLEVIAQKLQIPYAAARKRKSRALARLRKVFTKLSQKDRP